MKIETIKKNYTKQFLIGGLVTVGLVGSFVLGRSQAKYQQTQEMRLVNGSISYKPSDMQIMAMYQADSTSETGYKEITKMPSGGGVYN